MKRRIFLLAVAVSVSMSGALYGAEVVVKDGKWVKAATAERGTPEGDLAAVRQLLADGSNRKAIKGAEKFIDAFPGDEGGEEAMSLAGEAELNREHYWQSYQWYEQQVSQYPAGLLFERGLSRQAEIADAFLAGEKRIVWYIFRLGATEEGLEIHERVADRLPGSKLAERSMMTVAEYLFVEKRWVEAEAAYTRYGELFGGRYRSEEAELKAAHSVYNSFRSVEHDDTPLVESEQRYRAYMARYPKSAAGKEVSAILTEIEQTRARKDFEVAEFYARIGKDGPAVFYYREVIRQFPGTPWARQAAAALDEMGQALAKDGGEKRP